MEFVRIPRELIYNTGLGDKRIIVYSSLLFHGWNLERCTVTDLVIHCGYCADRHSSAMQQIFSNIIQKMDKIGYIKLHNQSKNSFTFFSKSPSDRFGIIYQYEYNAILEYRHKQKMNGRRINHAHALLLLSYIRLNMERQPGKPVVHFSMLNTISNNIGLSVRSISAAAKVLEALSIIHCEPVPRYKDSFGNWHTNVKIFANMQSMTNTNYNWQIETQLAVQKDYIGG